MIRNVENGNFDTRLKITDALNSQGEKSIISVLDAANSGDDILQLPNSDFVTDAQFIQSGNDLLLVLDSGETTIVENYFTTSPRPDLVAESDITLTARLLESFLTPVAPSQTAQAADGNAGDPIGSVEFLAGRAFAVRTDGTRVELKLGDPVYQGDQIETNEDGSIKMRFADDTIFTLGEDARLALDELVYDPGVSEGSR
ncbi:MAG: hypothetical protein R3261_12160, partial [Alphaproteobacteria bacterium]|nr:hypothetical protein [Alphaproteobacteria bacterium]